ncbi:MAG: glycosyltransferase family 8 protein [Butyrivibrio sp.]|nr:glycosyltransferase family 8 protein [Butyrivibrio sp.]
MNNLTFVFSADDNYIVPTYIAAHSLIYNAARDKKYDIYILAPGDISDSNKAIINTIEKDFDNVKIHFENMGDAFATSNLVIKHTTVPSMYRLLLPSILKDCDKCIYIDGDILVKGDLSPLFERDMDGYYVGAIKDIEAEQYISRFDYTTEKPDSKDYVNSGFLLMNLELMRRDKVEERFLDLSDKRFLFGDQDILNIVCKGKILFLELKYNTLVKYRFVNYKQKSYSKFITDHFTLDEILEAIEHPVMLHYAQPVKPWQCRYVYKADEWYKYIKKQIPKDIYTGYILPYIRSHMVSSKEKNKMLLHWLLYKIGVLQLILNMQHKL